jgi:hypothetical protein
MEARRRLQIADSVKRRRRAQRKKAAAASGDPVKLERAANL